jgi:hypothetical protein
LLVSRRVNLYTECTGSNQIYSAEAEKCVCQFEFTDLSTNVANLECADVSAIGNEIQYCSGDINVPVFHEGHVDCRVNLLPAIAECAAGEFVLEEDGDEFLENNIFM